MCISRSVQRLIWTKTIRQEYGDSTKLPGNLWFRWRSWQQRRWWQRCYVEQIKSIIRPFVSTRTSWWSFFHINDKSQIVISNVANYGRFQVWKNEYPKSLELLIFIPIWHLVCFDLKDVLNFFSGFTKSQEKTLETCLVFKIKHKELSHVGTGMHFHVFRKVLVIMYNIHRTLYNVHVDCWCSAHLDCHDGDREKSGQGQTRFHQHLSLPSNFELKTFL